MKWTIYLLIGIMVVSAVFADGGVIETYKPNEIFSLLIHLTNLSGDVVGANCSTQIRNSSLDVIENLQNIEIGGGFYNLTYNNSQSGNYFCRQNCTLGSSFTAETCNFLIKGDQMVMGVIILVPLFIAIFLLIVAWLLPKEAYPALKIGLILVSFVFVYQCYQFAVIALSSNNNTLIDSIGENTLIYTWVYGIVFAVILITFIYDLFMMFSNRKKHDTGNYEDKEE